MGPRLLRNRSSADNIFFMTEEFAPEYTKRERIRILVIYTTIGLILVAVGELSFFAWLGEFSKTANCHSYFGINGERLLVFGVFVGIPLLFATTIAAIFGTRGVRILRQGRTPPKGEKVFRPTPIQRGPKARTAGVIQLLIVLFAFAVVIYSAFQAQAFTSDSHWGKGCINTTQLPLLSKVY